MAAEPEEYSSTFDDLLLDDFEEEYDEFMLYILLNEIDDAEENAHGGQPLRNKDGSLRKVKRIDYSRAEKRFKISGNPWNQCNWLLLISDPETAYPESRQNDR